MSAPASWSAFLQSIIGAPVASRRALTSFAGMSTYLSVPSYRSAQHATLALLFFDFLAPFLFLFLGEELQLPLRERLGLGDELRLGRLLDLDARRPRSQALDDRLGHDVGEERDRADRVVVAGERIVDLVGVAVGVEWSDDRDAELARFLHGDVLLARVDDPDRGRKLRHLADAGKVLLEPLALGPELEDLLLRKDLEGTGRLHRLELAQSRQSLRDGLEV